MMFVNAARAQKKKNSAFSPGSVAYPSLFERALPSGGKQNNGSSFAARAKKIRRSPRGRNCKFCRVPSPVACEPVESLDLGSLRHPTMIALVTFAVEAEFAPWRKCAS